MAEDHKPATGGLPAWHGVSKIEAVAWMFAGAGIYVALQYFVLPWLVGEGGAEATAVLVRAVALLSGLLTILVAERLLVRRGSWDHGFARRLRPAAESTSKPRATIPKS